MPNLRNQIVAYQPRSAPITQQHRVPRLKGSSPVQRQDSSDSYARTLGQRAIEYPVQVDLSQPIGKAIKAVKSAYNFLAPHLPTTPFKGNSSKPKLSRTTKPASNSYTANINLEPKFVLRGTNTEVPASSVLVDTVSGRPGKPYVNTPSGPLIVSPVANSSGSYIMSRTGKNALSNVFRGTNVSTTRNAPAAISRRMNVVSKPRMSASRNGVIITHREYMSNITSSGLSNGFNAVGLTLNPGKIAAFPWLSTIAGNFDKYRILKCTISLVTNQPTTTAGRVGVGFDYDSTDPIPADRTDFFSLTHHAECAAWDSLDFAIPLQGGVRFVNSHTNTDSKLIDYGQVIVMADQVAATNANLGDVIISYSVELLDPQQAIMTTFMADGGLRASFDQLTLIGPSVAVPVPTVSTTVLDHRFAIGFYTAVFYSRDVGAGSPSIAFNSTTNAIEPFGRLVAFGNTTDFTAYIIFHVIRDGCIIRATYSGVAISALERQHINFTRVTPAAFRQLNDGNWQANLTNTL